MAKLIRGLGLIMVASLMVSTVGVEAGRARAGELADEDAEGGQGLFGQVVKLTGNHMPRVVVDREEGRQAPPKRGERTPLAVPVHVFRGRVKVFEKPNPDHPALVDIVQSDEEGRFRVALEPGVYTVVAEIDGRLYLNLFTARGRDRYWSTVRVEEGAWRAYTIADTSQAAF